MYMYVYVYAHAHVHLRVHVNACPYMNNCQYILYLTYT